MSIVISVFIFSEFSAPMQRWLGPKKVIYCGPEKDIMCVCFRAWLAYSTTLNINYWCSCSELKGTPNQENIWQIMVSTEFNFLKIAQKLFGNFDNRRADCNSIQIFKIDNDVWDPIHKKFPPLHDVIWKISILGIFGSNVAVVHTHGATTSPWYIMYEGHVPYSHCNLIGCIIVYPKDYLS